jgi:acyl dehydratase
MSTPITAQLEDGQRVYRLVSHRRTITETDIVSFVNLVGLHEPPFIDMDWVADNMPGEHARRFAPAPLLISLGMGLVATRIMQVVESMQFEEGLGAFHGMVGVQARVMAPVFPGDTLQVQLAGRVDRRTSQGQTLVDLEHTMFNQASDRVMVFTEKLLFDPAGQ